MNWIEGVGDEVTLFFALLAIALVGAMAWLSTNIGEQQLIRTVLVVERRVGHTLDMVDTRSSNVDSVGVTSHEVIYASVSQECECEENSTAVNTVPVLAQSPEPETVVAASSTPISEPTVHQPVINTNVVPRQRFPLLSTLNVQGGEPADPEPCSHHDPDQDSGQIWIRLKYLNDDQKLVQGRLEEPLGDFKRRHFTTELTADNLVRLIFNGHILQRDADTLESYGLFDNCVVHCLVHHHRTPTERTVAAVQSADNPAGDAHSDWNMGNILPVLLTLLLGMAWICRYQYAHLFNTTTTVALMGLSGILGVSLLGVYLPNQDTTATP